MRKREITILEDSQSIQIVFSNGEKSLYYLSKKAALLAVSHYYQRNKLSTNERDCLMDKIIHLIHFYAKTDICLDSIDRDFCQYFQFVECQCNRIPHHGFIWNYKGQYVAGPIYTKDDALDFINEIEELNDLSEGTLNNLESEVETSSLLESAELN